MTPKAGSGKGGDEESGDGAMEGGHGTPKGDMDEGGSGSGSGKAGEDIGGALSPEPKAHHHATKEQVTYEVE